MAFPYSASKRTRAKGVCLVNPRPAAVKELANNVDEAVLRRREQRKGAAKLFGGRVRVVTHVHAGGDENSHDFEVPMLRRNIAAFILSHSVTRAKRSSGSRPMRHVVSSAHRRLHALIVNEGAFTAGRISPAWRVWRCPTTASSSMRHVRSTAVSMSAMALRLTRLSSAMSTSQFSGSDVDRVRRLAHERRTHPFSAPVLCVTWNQIKSTLEDHLIPSRPHGLVAQRPPAHTRPNVMADASVFAAHAEMDRRRCRRGTVRMIAV